MWPHRAVRHRLEHLLHTCILYIMCSFVVCWQFISDDGVALKWLSFPRSQPKDVKREKSMLSQTVRRTQYRIHNLFQFSGSRGLKSSVVNWIERYVSTILINSLGGAKFVEIFRGQINDSILYMCRWDMRSLIAIEDIFALLCWKRKAPGYSIPISRCPQINIQQLYTNNVRTKPRRLQHRPRWHIKRNDNKRRYWITAANIERRPRAHI